MLNNAVQYILMQIPPQMRSEIENIHKMAIRGGNPEQFLMQRFGNNPNFIRALEIAKGKSPEELNNYLGNISRTFGSNR